MDQSNLPQEQAVQVFERPFEKAIFFVMSLSGLGSLGGLLFSSEIAPFTEGIFLSITWACFVYMSLLDQPAELKSIRMERAFLGFFALIAGLLVGVFGPNYLFTEPRMTQWLVMWGLLISAQIGFSLLLVSPLRSLAMGAGNLISAVVLHSAVFRYSGDFTEAYNAKVFVIVLLVISAWFFGHWLFFDRFNPLMVNEPKSIKGIRSFVGIAGGLLTVIEFFNIMYELYTLR